MKHILILTSDAGFGHRRAAEAIEAAVQAAYADRFSALLFNPLQEPSVPDLLKMLESGYDDLVVDDPTVYQLTYAATDTPVVARLLQRITTSALNQTLTRLLTDQQPDVIVTTYPAFTQAAVRATEEAGLDIPVDVVVTDLIGVHSLWFHDGADLTFVPTGKVYKQGIEEQRLPPAKVVLSGLPIHPRFTTETRTRREIREALGWQPDLTTALIVGSQRTRQTVTIARLLDQSGLPVQIAVVAGGDAESEKRLRETNWKGAVQVYGLVRNMPELMRAADFIICKAGGLIVTEALACGLPLILYEALPGQEEGNVRYVVNAGAGAWSPGAIGVLATAYAWLTGDQAELKQARTMAKQVGKPRAAFDIVDRIARQVGE